MTIRIIFTLLTTRFKGILGAQGYWEYSFWNREIKCILVHTLSRCFPLNLTLMHSFVKSQLPPGVNLSFVLHRSLHVIGARDMKNEHFHFLKKPRRGQLRIRVRQEKWSLSQGEFWYHPPKIAKTHPKLLQRLFWIPAFYDDFFMIIFIEM